MKEEKPSSFETESYGSSPAKRKRRSRHGENKDSNEIVTTRNQARGGGGEGAIPQSPLSAGTASLLLPKTSGRSTKSANRENNARSTRLPRSSESSDGSFGADGNDQNDINPRQSYRETGKEDSGRSFLEQLSVMADDPTQTKSQSIIRKIRLFCGTIVEDPKVQILIILLIVINAIIMGIATFDFVTDNPRVDKAFEQTDRVFLVIFTLELFLQLVYRSISFFSDSWLIFDFVIVVASWSLESLQIVRAFRIFRAFRLVTRIGPLRELVMAIAAVMPRMYAIAMLLFLIFYIFAVLFTELFSELELSDNYFGSLDVSLFTCMEMMTLEWADTTREIMEQKSWAWAPLLAFISVTGFIVFNLIVAVVCDAVAVVDREAMAEKHPEILTDKQKLEEAQERIWELTETVEILMMRQERLLSVADMLAKEVRTAVMSPAAAAAAPPANPLLKSAMKNSGRNTSIGKASLAPTSRRIPGEGIGTVSHSSNDDDEDRLVESKSVDVNRDGVDRKNVDNFSDSLERDVQLAIDRITLGRASNHSGASSRNSWKPRTADGTQKGTSSTDGATSRASHVSSVG